MSVLDGYSVKQIPEPRRGGAIVWSQLAAIYAGPTGIAWTIENHELMRFDGALWTSLAKEEPGDTMIAAMPVGTDAVLVLLADRIALFQPSSHSWRILKTSLEIGSFSHMVPGFHNDYWITASHGIVQLKLNPGFGIQSWKQLATDDIGLVEIEQPLPSSTGAAGEELFVTGRRREDGSVRAVARWFDVETAHPGIEIVRTATPDNLRGWRGPDGTLWTIEGASLRRLLNGRWVSVEKYGMLAGTLYEVVTEQGGGFWIGTSEGIAHYAPSVWTTADFVKQLDQPVHAITEDRQGRLWFAATDYLLELDGASWSAYPWPHGVQTQAAQSDTLWMMADGRIAAKLVGRGTEDHVFLFDPSSRKFSELLHPGGREIRLIKGQPDGTVLAWSTPGSRLERV